MSPRQYMIEWQNQGSSGENPNCFPESPDTFSCTGLSPDPSPPEAISLGKYLTLLDVGWKGKKGEELVDSLCLTLLALPHAKGSPCLHLLECQSLRRRTNSERSVELIMELEFIHSLNPWFPGDSISYRTIKTRPQTHSRVGSPRGARVCLV